MNTACEEIRDYLYVLDAGREHPEVATALDHLEGCEPCQREAARIQSFDEELSTALNDVEIPDRLVERCARIPHEPPYRAGTPSGLNRRAVGAALVALAAAVVAVLFISGEDTRSADGDLVSLAVADHQAHPPSGGEPAAVEPTLHASTPEAWSTFRRINEQLVAKGFTLVSCSACPWHERKVDHLYYRRGDEVVSLFMVPGARSEVPESAGIARADGLTVQLLRGSGDIGAAIVAPAALGLSV